MIRSSARPHRARHVTRITCIALCVAVGCRPAGRAEGASDGAIDTAIGRGGAADSLRAIGTEEIVAPEQNAAARAPRASNGPPPTPTGDELAALAAGIGVPVEGVLPANLGDSFNEMRGERRHDALDIMAARGTRVLAATDGRLLKLYDSKRGGLMIYASDPSDRFVLLYGHLDRFAPGLVEGTALRRGQYIGDVGSTGNASPDAPHLHFGIARVADTRQWWRGTPVDPRPLLVR